MTVKEHINQGPIWKVCNFLDFTLSPHLCYSFKITNCGMREKIFFLAVSAYHVISKEVGNIVLYRVFRHNCILDKHVCIKNLCWQNCGIIISLWKYYTVILDVLIGSWIFYSCCLLYSSFIRLQEEKVNLEKNIYRERERNLCQGHLFSAARPPSFVIFSPVSDACLLPTSVYGPEHEGELIILM